MEDPTIFFTCILRSTITLLALKFRLYINTSLTLMSSKRHISLRVMFFESLLFVCVLKGDKLGVHFSWLAIWLHGLLTQPRYASFHVRPNLPSTHQMRDSCPHRLWGRYRLKYAKIVHFWVVLAIEAWLPRTLHRSTMTCPAFPPNWDLIEVEGFLGPTLVVWLIQF